MTDRDLLRALIEIPSLSGEEAAASAFLAGWMAQHGMQGFVDAAGNAIGILDGGLAGPQEGAARPQDIVLLGHIDTVGGDVTVRSVDGKLYGRGAVDAKGPLAAFAAAAARVGVQRGWRIIVIGAVEEESGTSKGAVLAAAQYQPALCIIGEPSGWNRITLGYKGWLSAQVMVQRTMAHTAGPGISACELAVEFWNALRRRVAEINTSRDKAWDQVLPSLRSFDSSSDGLAETARLAMTLRLPPDVGPEIMKAELRTLAEDTRRWQPLERVQFSAQVTFQGQRDAFRSDKNNALVRAFLSAIRSQGDQPGFVLKTGTSDMNVVGPLWKCPIVAYGPGDSSLDHTPEEHVDWLEWERGVSVLAEVLHRVCS